MYNLAPDRRHQSCDLRGDWFTCYSHEAGQFLQAGLVVIENDGEYYCALWLC